MLAVRAAIFALLLGLLSSHSIFFRSSTTSPAKDGVFAVFRLDSSLVRPVVVGLLNSSTVSRFSPWKARPKIVLMEADHQFLEESDLGPASPTQTQFAIVDCSQRATPSSPLAASLLKLLALCAPAVSVRKLDPPTHLSRSS